MWAVKTRLGIVGNTVEWTELGILIPGYAVWAVGTLGRVCSCSGHGAGDVAAVLPFLASHEVAGTGIRSGTRVEQALVFSFALDIVHTFPSAFATPIWRIHPMRS